MEAGSLARISMTNTQIPRVPARYLIESLIVEHGFWRVIRETLRARSAVRKAARIVASSDISNHLRRDMGLPTQAPPPMKANYIQYLR